MVYQTGLWFPRRKGFYDATSGIQSPHEAFFDRVIEGDTLLLLALRKADAKCAAVLAEHGADLQLTNCEEHKPIVFIFEAFAALEQNKRELNNHTSTNLSSTKTTNSTINKEMQFFRRQVLQRPKDFEFLLEKVAVPLQEYHDDIKNRVSEQLYNIYEQCAPERVAKIPLQMHEFHCREFELLDLIQRKYLSN